MVIHKIYNFKKLQTVENFNMQEKWSYPESALDEEMNEEKVHNAYAFKAGHYS